MRTPNARELRLVIAAVAIGLLSLVQMAVVRPSLQRVKRSKGKALESARELERMRRAVAEKKKVETSYNEVQSRITSSKTPEREIIDMLQAIEKAAVDSGVEVLQNVHVKDEPFEYFSRHTVHFRGAGEPESLFRMVYALQSARQMLKAPEMRFAIKNHRVEMDLDITRIVCRQGNHG